MSSPNPYTLKAVTGRTPTGDEGDGTQSSCTVGLPCGPYFLTISHFFNPLTLLKAVTGRTLTGDEGDGTQSSCTVGLSPHFRYMRG